MSNINFDEKRMVLVIKPTEACNFSCTFCSSANLVDDKKKRLELKTIFQFLERYPRTQVIFVVGGDPLMMSPSYYEKLISYIEENKLPTRISMTTNLWDFYKNPEKWKKVLNHPLVEVGTSFQYGEGRQISPGKPFTEEIFIDVYRKFSEYVPTKELCFIAVVNKENEHLAIDHVHLAKRLNIQCRLVYQSMSGRAGDVYPISKLYEIILKIYKLGLAEFEQTALAISDKIYGLEGSCPVSRNCDSWMRSLNADGRYFTCGPLNDDLDTRDEIDFEQEVVKGKEFFTPLQKMSELQYLKEECITCKMFQTCNGCRKHTKDLLDKGIVEEHCSIMKSITDDLINMSESSEIKVLKEVTSNHSLLEQ